MASHLLVCLIKMKIIVFLVRGAEVANFCLIFFIFLFFRPNLSMFYSSMWKSISIFRFVVKNRFSWSLQLLPSLEKVRPYGRHFPSSFGELQPLAATGRPFGPNNRALRANPKFLKIKIRLENFAEFHFETFAEFQFENIVEICLEYFEEIHLEIFCGNPFWKFCKNPF